MNKISIKNQDEREWSTRKRTTPECPAINEAIHSVVNFIQLLIDMSSLGCKIFIELLASHQISWNKGYRIATAPDSRRIYPTDIEKSLPRYIHIFVRPKIHIYANTFTDVINLITIWWLIYNWLQWINVIIYLSLLEPNLLWYHSC